MVTNNSLNNTCSNSFSVTGGNLTVTRASTGDIYSSVSNTNVSSAANAALTAQAANGGGDAFWAMSDTSFIFTGGVDQSDSHKFKMGFQGNPSAGTESIVVTTAGNVSFPVGNVTVDTSSVSASSLLVVQNTGGSQFAQVVAQAAATKTGCFSSGQIGAPGKYWNFGMASTLSNAFCLNYATSTQAPEGGTIVLKADQGGAITMPLQPRAFTYLGVPTGAVTGDGTVYTILYDNSNYIQGISYNAGTGVFTVNTTGTYQIVMRTTMGSISSIMTFGGIGLTGSINPSILVNNPANLRNSNNQIDIPFFYQVELTAGDTFASIIQISNGALAATVNDGTCIWITLIN